MAELYRQGAIPKTELDTAELAAIRAEQLYTSSKNRLSLTMRKASTDEIASAKARLAQANQRLRLAKENLSRNPKLDALAQARNQLKAAEVNLENARADLVDTKIKAPITGTIASMRLVVGDQLPQQGAVCQIIDISHLQVRASVDEVDIGKIALGQKTILSFDALADDAEFEGHITHIAAEGVNTNGVTLYDVLIGFDPGQSSIKPGMNSDCHIILESADGVITVPSSAILDRNGRKLLMVMEGGEANYRRVRVGIQGDGGIEIQRGVEVGEQVVINPNIGRADNSGGLGGMMAR